MAPAPLLAIKMPARTLGAAVLVAAASAALIACCLRETKGAAFVTDASAPHFVYSRHLPGLGPPQPSVALPAGRDLGVVSGDASASPSFAGVAAFAAAICAIAGSMKRSQRAGLVVRHYFPSACGRPKQKVLRRLEPYGLVPGWSTRLLVKRRLITPWRKHPTTKPSFFKRQLLEKQRVRFHYNVKERQMRIYMRAAFRKGVEFPVENLLQQLEGRLDNTVFRLGLAPTMAAARRFVRQGHIQYMTGSMMKDWRTVSIPSQRLKVGDVFRVSDREGSKNHAKFYMDQVEDISIPDHLKWDKEKLEGEYLDICNPTQLGIDIEERYIAMWYAGHGRYRQLATRRRHFRYFPGTNKVIPMSYNGGRPTPTPENLLNMKRGIGLNKRGRARPPCLWGRRKPLNDPYEF